MPGPGNLKRLWLLRIARVVGAVGIAVWAIDSLTPTLRFEDSYVKILIAAAVAAALLAGVF